jgi:hypothetical protein
VGDAAPSLAREKGGGMTTRGVAIQGGLAAFGLVLAYTTWQREPERPPGESVVFDLTKNDLAQLRYEDGPKWAVLEPRADPDSDGPVIWMKVSGKPETKIPDRELRGSEAASKLFEKFAPLRATRALGVLPADKLKELGLEDPKKKVEVTSRSGVKQTLLVGNSPYGVSEPYVKDAKDGKVYVLGASIIADLDGASLRLVDRTLHTWKKPDFDELTLSAGGKKRELVQSSAALPANAKLAPKATPDKADDTAKNWHDKVFMMSAVDALGVGEKPAAGDPQVIVRIDYTAKGKPKGWIELGRLIAPPPPPNPKAPPNAPPPGPVTESYARTEHTAGWVKLPAGTDEVLKEGETLAAKE